MTDILPDTNAAISFLTKLWCPPGPWALTAIHPDTKIIETKFFTADQIEVMRSWIDRYNGISNLYFAPNPLLGPVSKKASREDIAEMVCLYVDMDPEPREDFAAERARILATLQTSSGVPPLTGIIDSGGGYQGYIVLDKPFQINGEETRYEEAKRWNQQLEVIFNADHCHNVDRIMRLPGTVNIPDARKKAKGRKPALANVVEWHSERVYPLEWFTPAPAKPSEAVAVKVEIGDSFPRLADVNDLPESVSWLAKVVISQGHDPDKPDRWPSRSEALFYVCCELVREKVPDDLIFGIVTDPEWGISASVLEKNNPRSYATRQIAKAHQKVNDDKKQNSSLILFPGAPLQSAEVFRDTKMRHLRLFNDDWLDYRDAAYIELEKATIRSSLYHFLNGAVQKVKDDKSVPFAPTKDKVNNVLDALASLVHVPRTDVAPPAWLNGDTEYDPREIISCHNGLLHLPSGKFLPPTPAFFTRNALQFEYKADAPKPVEWLKFLDTVWDKSRENITALQEIFGYLLTPATDQQKIFLLIGPPRSGKGTIAHVIRNLVGDRNTTSPTLQSMTRDFGLENLIGKQLAIISDMRLGFNDNQDAVAENLLRISGEDSVAVSRKYKTEWNGVLSVRFLIMSNELPHFRETSGALANRFVPLIMTESFLGKEDLGLRHRLLAELPGILLWAIEGWRRLQQRQVFTIAESVREAIIEMAHLASPVKAFIDERCVLNPLAAHDKDDLYAAYQVFCIEKGLHAKAKNTFSKDLRTATGRKVQPGKSTGTANRKPVFQGITLVGPSQQVELLDQSF